MERSIDELIELLNDKDDFVVEDVIGELELRKEEALDPLIDALSHRKKNVRLHAATLLGAINDPKAIEPLKGLYKEGLLVMLIRLAHSAMVSISSSLPKYSAAAVLTPVQRLPI